MAAEEKQIVKPYHQTNRFSLYEGDCRSVLPIFAECSVDSIVCDPPYELGFMNKGWDRSGIAYDVSVWQECLRVLKPGGHLLAFGGSRTYHRLACAVEDAGFEIRDQIQYIYGSGFPKSLNVSKNLREEGSVCTCNEHDRDLLSLQGRISNVESMAQTSQDANLFASVQWSATRAGMGHARSQGAEGENTRELPKSSDARREESSMEGRRNLFSEARELQADQVREMPAGVSTDGPEGWLRDGAPSNHGSMDRASSEQNGSGSSRRSRSAEQQARQPSTLSEQPRSQIGGAWPLCGRCGKPVVAEGLGSALKPAHEPIVVARKPLTGTLIQNVLQHGTGGLNIDGCRIGDEKGWPASESLFKGWQKSGESVATAPRGTGRWPANVIHDGSDEVLAVFPDAPGQQAALNGTELSGAFSRWSEGLLTRNPFEPRGDSGSAARFFYCAKATQDDRNEGCEDLPQRVADDVHKRPRTELDDPRRHGVTPRQNNHPTVKPTDLMRYLCRLITPPSGLVLDPFCGSGSTGKAAMLEGLRFIGIELNADYCQLAQRRIEAATKQGLLFT